MHGDSHWKIIKIMVEKVEITQIGNNARMAEKCDLLFIDGILCNH